MSSHFILSVTAIVIMFNMLFVAFVSANGVHPRAKDVFVGSVGPYSVTVATHPVVGDIHLTINVTRIDGVALDRRPRVRVQAKSPATVGRESRIVGPFVATGALSAPNLYGLNMMVDEPGLWQFSLMLGDDSHDELVEGAMVPLRADFSLEVVADAGINWALRVGAPSLAVLATWGFLEWRRRKKSQSR